MTDDRFRDAWARLVAAWSSYDAGSADAEALLRRALDEGLHPVAAGLAAVRRRRRRCRDVAARSPWSGCPGRSTRPATWSTTRRRPSAARSRSTTSAAAAGAGCATRPSTSTCGGTSRSTSTPPTTPRPRSTPWSTTWSTAGSAGCCRCPRPTPRPATVLAGPPRRVCLFALYDPDGLVDDYVVDYVTELARFADVYVLSDCEMQPGQLDRLDGLVRGSWARRHGAHDFGSWSLLARELVGWEALDGVRRGRCSPTTAAGCSGRSTRSSRGWTGRPATSGPCR